MSVNERGEGVGSSRFTRREEPSISELVTQQKCEHRWMVLAMAAGSSPFEFRHCPRCGKRTWLGPAGPVELHDVLRVVARAEDQRPGRSATSLRARAGSPSW
jgi:hypothetical protein